MNKVQNGDLLEEFEVVNVKELSDLKNNQAFNFEVTENGPKCADEIPHSKVSEQNNVFSMQQAVQHFQF